MKRVLVTGATGFIGGHLAGALVQRGDAVKCLVRSQAKARQLADMGALLVEGDVNSPESVSAAVQDVDCVYHLAGAVRALNGKAMWRVNALGTQTLLGACAALNSPPTFLHVSSIAAAGPCKAERPKRERDPCRPVSNYGRSKRASEAAAAEAADRLPVTIVRPPIVFGPRDRPTLMFYRPVKRFGILAVPSSWENRYSFIHCDDLVEALIAVAEKGKRLKPGNDGAEGFEQGCYFVAYDPPVTYFQFGELVGKAVGRQRIRPMRAGDFVIRTGGRISDVVAQFRRQPLLFSYDKAREATAGSWACSPELIEAECGYRPAASFAQRVEQTARWLFDNGWLRARRNSEKQMGELDLCRSALRRGPEGTGDPSYAQNRESTP